MAHLATDTERPAENQPQQADSSASVSMETVSKYLTFASDQLKEIKESFLQSGGSSTVPAATPSPEPQALPTAQARPSAQTVPGAQTIPSAQPQQVPAAEPPSILERLKATAASVSAYFFGSSEAPNEVAEKSYSAELVDLVKRGTSWLTSTLGFGSSESAQPKVTKEELASQHTKLLTELEAQLTQKTTRLQSGELTEAEREKLNATIGELTQLRDSIDEAFKLRVSAFQEQAAVLKAQGVVPADDKELAQGIAEVAAEAQRHGKVHQELKEKVEAFQQGKIDFRELLASIQECEECSKNALDVLQDSGTDFRQRLREKINAADIPQERKERALARIDALEKPVTEALERAEVQFVRVARSRGELLLTVARERAPELYAQYTEQVYSIGQRWEQALDFRWTVGLSSAGYERKYENLFMFVGETEKLFAEQRLRFGTDRGGDSAQSGLSAPALADKKEESLAADLPDFLKSNLDFRPFEGRDAEKLREALERRGINTAGRTPTAAERLNAFVAQLLG
ncbi:MAG: hypothetical protein KDD69_13600 [Bdellovibrionales bacterium]|nr:hypothetical protein [Bdellovibrionales bacterium]